MKRIKRVKNRKRFEMVSQIIAGMINASFIIVLFLILVAIMPKKTVEAYAMKYEEYVVSTGETLWSIASENKKDGQDVREYIYELRKLNDLDDCMIYSNQVIKILK